MLLSRGFGAALARHPEAFRGFPLRIEAQLKQGAEKRGFTADFRPEARSIVVSRAQVFHCRISSVVRRELLLNFAEVCQRLAR